MSERSTTQTEHTTVGTSRLVAYDIDSFSLPWAKCGEAIELSALTGMEKTMSKRAMVVTPLTMEKSMMGLHLRVIPGSYDSHIESYRVICFQGAPVLCSNCSEEI